MVVFGAPRADGADHGREVPSPAIRQVVAVDRGDHDMSETQPGHGIGHTGRLVRIQSGRLTRAHVAERAGAGTGVAHDHHGGVTLRPALADIRAGGLLANRDQPVLPHEGAGLVINWVGGRLHPDPGGLALDRVIGPVRLLGMAQDRGSAQPMVDQNARGHEPSAKSAAGSPRESLKKWMAFRDPSSTRDPSGIFRQVPIATHSHSPLASGSVEQEDHRHA